NPRPPTPNPSPPPFRHRRHVAWRLCRNLRPLPPRPRAPDLTRPSIRLLRRRRVGPARPPEAWRRPGIAAIRPGHRATLHGALSGFFESRLLPGDRPQPGIRLTRPHRTTLHDVSSECRTSRRPILGHHQTLD